MNSPAVQTVVDDQQTQKYLTLLELSKVITSHRDLSELFHELACGLQDLFPFRDMAVMLHDEHRNVMRSYIMEGCAVARWVGKESTEVSLDDSINGHVWKSQTPLIIDNLDEDFRFPAAQIIRDGGIKSVCCIPLSTVHQKLGTLNLWSEDVGAYRDFDIAFAQLVAGQIAVAVEAHLQRQQIAHDRDRSQLLLQVNNTLVSNLNLRELLSAISLALSPVMPHEAAALTLYEESSNELRVAAFDFPEDEGNCVTGRVIPFAGNPIGEAFTTRKTVVIDYSQSDDPQIACSGFISGCASPLIFHDRALGVLAIKTRREHAFSAEDAELLEQVAKQVAIAVENALAYNEIETLKNKLEKEKLYLEEEIRTEYNFEEIIGSSSVLKRVLKNVETVATTDSTVLIYGETGTGKELIARAIHNLSDRRERTLVKVNCAAIPTGLLESELFGHEKGAFTGAIDRRIGRFELAHQGTIVLDEVEDIPLDLQSKLLRVLQ
jgi:formate hydrogenlyase transcriptional activator